MLEKGSKDVIQTYDTAISAILAHEGGYCNEPDDPGGPTNWGITIADARKYWKGDASAADVRAMPLPVAKDIYRKHYAFPVRYNDLPAGVDYSVLDYGINSGTGRAGKVLRRLCGLPDNTSAIDDTVIAAVLKRKPADLIEAINSERLAFLRTLKNWPTYQNGWTRRVREVRAMSLNMATQPAAPVSLPQPAPGKGQVAEPKAAKKVIVTAGGAGSVGLIAWAHQHPALSLLAIMAAAGAIVGVVYLINLWRENRQQAATPGITPVKETT